MRSLFLFLIILSGLAAGILPYATGFLFKTQIENYIRQLTFNSNSSTVQVKLENYHLAWNQSTATIKLTYRQNETANINLVIHHGPLIRWNNKFFVAQAFIEGNVNYANQDWLRLVSVIDFNQTKWKFHYSTNNIQLPAGMQWNGISGDVITSITGAAISNIRNQMQIEQLTYYNPLLKLNLHLEPVSDSLSIDIANNGKISISHEINTAGLALMVNNQPYLQLKGMALNQQTATDDYLISAVSDGTLETSNSILLPALNPASEIKFHCNLSGINRYGLKKLNLQDKAQSAMSSITNNSKLNFNLDTTSKIGNLSVTLEAAATNKFETLDELINGLVFNFNLKVSQQLFVNLLANILVLYHPTDAIALNNIPEQSAQTILQQLINDGLAATEGNDLTISAAKTADNTNANGQKVINAVNTFFGITTTINTSRINTPGVKHHA